MKKMKPKRSKISIFFSLVLLTLAAFGVYNVLTMKSSTVQELTYPQFLTEVDKGQIKQITISDNNPLLILRSDGTYAHAPNPQDPSFKSEMYKKGVDSIVTKKSTNWTSIIFNVLFYGIIILVIFNIFFKSKSNGGINGLFNAMKPNLKSNSDGNMRTASFSDISGIDEAKEELLEVVDFLKHPKKYSAMNIRMPKGVILHGPPGTGKTLLARATASEASVPFISIGGSEFVEMFVGVGAKRVRTLFEEARKKAPCVLFIDEFDAIGKQRGGKSSSNDERDQTLNQILLELDGCTSSDGIVVIAATNRLELLDKALIRPGRFDRHIEVGLPDVKGRYEILKIHAKRKPIDKNVDLQRIAKQTIGFAGANLENLLNEAGMMAIRNNRKQISFSDIDDAFNRVIAGAKKKHNSISSDEMKTVAYHEAGHALVAKVLANSSVEKVTIAPTGNALGYVLHSPKDNKLSTKKELFHNICIALGGRAAEIMLNGKENVTTGASQDFRQATKTAYQMVSVFGMSDLGVIAIDDEAENMWMRLSDDIKNEAFNEVKKLLKEAEEETERFIDANKQMLIDIAEYLIEHESMDSEKLDELVSPKVTIPSYEQEKVAFALNAQI